MRKIIPILLLLIFSVSLKAISTPILNSFSSAKPTIFLDFDGHYVHASLWNGGDPINCATSGFNDDQIKEVFLRVSEDYRPFNINITTDSTVFLAAPLTRRMRIIITPTSSWYGNVGGVSYTRSFTWGDDTPGFVFSDKLNYVPKNIAECCTHESGHTLGLSHQAKYNGTCDLVATYNNGSGSGETGWAPVMGNSYGRNLSGWNNGPTPSGCTADQDNLSIITGINGFTYRVDEHSDVANETATQLTMNDAKISGNGIITTNLDKDVFQINLSLPGALQLDANPFSIGVNNEGANLDIKMTLMNGAKQIIGEFDPRNKLSVSIDTMLNAGLYYVMVEGAGNSNTSNYGSLGSYTLSGNYKMAVVLPVSQVLLSGKSIKGKHDISWKIITDVELKDISVEASDNGTIFTNLVTLNASTRNFDYSPLDQKNKFYRLKVVSITGSINYSNIISLDATANTGKKISVTSLVSSEIVINASEDFQYRLTDMSGRVIKSGKANAGISNININNSPNGIYVMQINSGSQRISQRVVKL